MAIDIHLRQMENGKSLALFVFRFPNFLSTNEFFRFSGKKCNLAIDDKSSATQLKNFGFRIFADRKRQNFSSFRQTFELNPPLAVFWESASRPGML